MKLNKRDFTVGIPLLVFAVCSFFVSTQVMQVVGIILSVWLLSVWACSREVK